MTNGSETADKIKLLLDLLSPNLSDCSLSQTEREDGPWSKKKKKMLTCILYAEFYSNWLAFSF